MEDSLTDSATNVIQIPASSSSSLSGLSQRVDARLARFGVRVTSVDKQGVARTLLHCQMESGQEIGVTHEIRNESNFFQVNHADPDFATVVNAFGMSGSCRSLTALFRFMQEVRGDQDRPERRMSELSSGTTASERSSQSTTPTVSDGS